MIKDELNYENLSAFCGRSWVEIDLDQAESNLRAIQSRVGNDCGVIAVVKANAYGHGAVEVGKAFLRAGARLLAVSCLDEALVLRDNGIEADILLLAEGEPERHEEGIRSQVTYAVYSKAKAKALSEAALALGTTVKIHIKIDSGMGRIGFPAELEESRVQILEISHLPGLEVEGIFTHFATADGFDMTEDEQCTDSERGEAYLHKQFKAFVSLTEDLEAGGLRFRYRHCANSPTTLRHPEMQLDLVRPGLLLYGLRPDNCLQDPIAIKPFISLHSRVIQSKILPAGSSVSYGRRFVAEKDTPVVTVPIGYADGYRRCMTGKCEALIAGQRVRQVGTICMDAMLFDVSALPVIPEEGTEVILIGGSDEQRIGVDEVAHWQETINYEVPCALSSRLPRVYRRKGNKATFVPFLN